MGTEGQAQLILIGLNIGDSYQARFLALPAEREQVSNRDKCDKCDNFQGLLLLVV